MTTGQSGMPDGYGAPYGNEPPTSGFGSQSSGYGAPQYQNPQYENQPYESPQYSASPYSEPPYSEPQYSNPTPQQPYSVPQQPYPAAPQPYYAAQPPVPYGGYGAVAVPSLAATILVTIFFGLFGLIPAAIHSQRATQLGRDGSRYWKAFGITFGIEIAITVLFYILIFALAAMRSTY